MLGPTVALFLDTFSEMNLTKTGTEFHLILVLAIGVTPIWTTSFMPLK